MLKTINRKVNEMSAVLDRLTQQVSETKTVIDSAILLIQGLRDQLIAAQNDPERIQELIDELDASEQSLAQAVSDNTEPITEEPQ
jgi:chromosome segregation ATPase